MAVSPLSNVLQYPVQEPERERLAPREVDISDDPTSFQDGAKITELPDGSAEIDLSPKTDRATPDRFNANLAEHMEESELNQISTDILEGIARDDQSRSEHLEMLAEGMKLLGLVIESPNVTAGNSSAPLEGMSTVRHPLLLEACQLFQANAMGEMLPASGPVKIRDDRPQRPDMPPPMIGHNGGPPLDNPFAAPGGSPPSSPGLGAPGMGASPPSPPAGPLPHPPMPPGGPQASVGAPPVPPPPPIPAPPLAPVEGRDELADALEKDFNHYLTVDAPEYVPDTDQMLFKIGFGGLGIKKVYNCPVRRRPVSESVDIEDFIVSNALTDLSNAGRVTQRIKMRPSVLKRMQILKVYRDVQIGMPTQSESPNAIDQAKAEVAGVTERPDPRDADHVIYECYCELNLDEYAPKQFKGKELPLPYKVSIDKDSQKVLEVRRNWRENDKECLAATRSTGQHYMRWTAIEQFLRLLLFDRQRKLSHARRYR